MRNAGLKVAGRRIFNADLLWF